MVFIRELARAITGADRGKRNILVLKFYCDESFDSDPKRDPTGIIDGKYVPRTFVVGGFLAEERIWTRLERRWSKCNEFFGIKRYHGTYVNAHDGEFLGWEPKKLNAYSGRLLRILGDQKRYLCAVSCGLKSRDYHQIISDAGRAKWGNPYIVCFKQCIALIAQLMSNLPPDYRFSVLVDRSDFQEEASKVFDVMKFDSNWKDHDRLVTCTPGSVEDFIALEPADLIAYETFRLFDTIHKEAVGVRYALRAIFPQNAFVSNAWDAKRLNDLKVPIENAPVAQNGFIILSPEVALDDQRFQLLSEIQYV